MNEYEEVKVERLTHMQSENVCVDDVDMLLVFELRPQNKVKSWVSGEVYFVPFPSGHGEGKLICLANSVFLNLFMRPMMAGVPGKLPRKNEFDK